MKTSFQSFALLTRKQHQKLIQPIQVRQNILLRGRMRKCLTCGGIPRITLDGNVTGFQSKFVPYQHQSNCSQKENF